MRPNLTSTGQEIYLKINRTQAGMLFKMKWDRWYPYQSGAPILLLGCSDVPKLLYASSRSNGEEHYWPKPVQAARSWIGHAHVLSCRRKPPDDDSALRLR